MALKLANNATGRLASNITNTDTTIQLRPGEGALFPALAAGDWFPLTVLRADGTREIMYATAIAGDVVTVQRGKENTSPLAFIINDRAELRATAAVFADLLPKAGGTITSNLAVAGTLGVTGAFSASSNATIAGTLAVAGAITQAGSALWTTANFNPASYLPLTGGQLTGQITIANTSPTIVLSDTDWGVRQLHCNGGMVGFLTSAGGWGCYSNNDGSFVASGNIGAYSDRKHKKRIRTIKHALDLVEALRGVRYVRKRDDRPCVGVIAQEVRQVLPEVVGTSEDGLYVDYGNLVGPLIEAVKELAARVRALEGA
ncbi:hypothetical protein D3C87_1256850 [compost metagenome]